MSKPDAPIDYIMLGQHIRDARKAKGITQDQLAERLDVSLSHVGKIERGERFINLDRLAEVSVVLGGAIEDLIAGCVYGEKDAVSIINATLPESLEVIRTLFKGQTQKTINLAVTLVNDLIRGLE